MNKKTKKIALIFAGGVGSRMGYKNGPKQFMEAGDKPVLVYTLERFQNHSEIDCIYLAVVSTHMDYTKYLVDKYGLSKVVKVSQGGSTAIETIQLTLQLIVNDDHSEDSVVIVHDGVRPIVSKQLITNCINLTEIAGNAVSCIPATETVCKSNDGVLADKMMDRNQMFILQAPQSFKLGMLHEVNTRILKESTSINFVDQASIARFFDIEINLVPGLRDNIKITTPPDYEYFSYLVKTGKYAEITEG